MINTEYCEGDLVVGKSGTNPWWPAVVMECPKTNQCYVENNNNWQVFIRFLEINTETWIETGHVIKCVTRQEMDRYLSQAQKTSTNMKYVNNVAEPMIDLYEKAWRMYGKLQLKKRSNILDQTNGDGGLQAEDVGMVTESVSESNLQPCEICLSNAIEFDCSELNKRILAMTPDERRRHFTDIMVQRVNGITANECRPDSSSCNVSGNCEDNSTYNGADKSPREVGRSDSVRCSNYCVWEYHKRCVPNGDNDFVCSCNKSIWMCSICNQVISVAQLFVCNNHECMRPYHRACLSWHLESAPDTKQCPLHQCLNCSLDYLVPDEEAVTASSSGCLGTGSLGITASIIGQSTRTLVACVKCKVAFHNEPDCLPACSIPVTSALIICHRHLVQSTIPVGSDANASPEHQPSIPAQLQLRKTSIASFCFSCARSTDENTNDKSIPIVSCKFCAVSYHKAGPCLPTSLDIIDDADLGSIFVCNGCRYPFVRRENYPLLLLPESVTSSHGVSDWVFGMSVDVSSGHTNTGNGISKYDEQVDMVTVKDASGSHWQVPISRTISINLQSLEHLQCFGVWRFDDMQLAIRNLSDLISRVADRWKLRQCLYRSAFVTQYAGLFPVMDNVYGCRDVQDTHNMLIALSKPWESISNETGNKCACSNACSTSKCTNVAANKECTSANCTAVASRCRNRRMQRRQYPRSRLIIDEQRGPSVMLEEAVVKDILVAEILGQVRSASALTTLEKESCLIVPLQDDAVLDCSRFCNITRFFQLSDSPNVQPKCVDVSGIPRIGLFSTRRITKGEVLRIHPRCFSRLDMDSKAGLARWEDGANPTEYSPLVAVPMDTVEPACEDLEPSVGEVIMIPVSPIEEISQTELDYVSLPMQIDPPCTDTRQSNPQQASKSSSNWPLCPACFLELALEPAGVRELAHCTRCFTVLHRACTGVSSQVLLGRHGQYLCPSCR